MESVVFGRHVKLQIQQFAGMHRGEIALQEFSRIKSQARFDQRSIDGEMDLSVFGNPSGIHS